ncbi:hypothetical protein IAQ61_007189 [Plenodomus lingam]|uniref:Predicted protein n=1 Tax=Leptosphaeria maculans (strain JN3 / isolate v23.1.3 / race Av1-4-5-6-7-8) TaxID=985895 RepID=E5A1C7_LEPMJ|nr:predicted protein [Plenodomus lingam JN3]KAH9867885.1 hypothetical protein IAQ61_007189 [Plenodomus lingam]CBX97391.1 predicted protein [Plenodomus lingam JN3]
MERANGGVEVSSVCMRNKEGERFYVSPGPLGNRMDDKRERKWKRLWPRARREKVLGTRAAAAGTCVAFLSHTSRLTKARARARARAKAKDKDEDKDGGAPPSSAYGEEVGKGRKGKAERAGLGEELMTTARAMVFIYLKYGLGAK